MQIGGNLFLPKNPFSAVIPSEVSPDFDFLAGRLGKSSTVMQWRPNVEISLASAYLAYRIYQTISNPSSQIIDLDTVIGKALIKRAPSLWEVSKISAQFVYNTGCFLIPDTCNSIESWANWTVDAVKIGTPAVATGILSTKLPSSVSKSFIYAAVAVMNVAMFSMGAFNPFR